MAAMLMIQQQLQQLLGQSSVSSSFRGTAFGGLVALYTTRTAKSKRERLVARRRPYFGFILHIFTSFVCAHVMATKHACAQRRAHAHARRTLLSLSVRTITYDSTAPPQVLHLRPP